MSSDITLDRLVNQCKSNDVDDRVDALTKLQALFESGVEIENSETLINIFKNCLRSSNQHLTNAAIYALPPLLPLLITRSQNGVIDASTLRIVLLTLLPLVIERLGDKDRVQVRARDSIVLVGGYSFKSGAPSVMATRSRDGKGPETPMSIFERLLKETGLASKVWKIREQSILVLVHIRRVHSLFPIRPHLSLLVDCLEDTDAHVRDCARSSVVELFSGSGVTDAARADLKKEMAKKNVRKAIADGVLSKLLGISSTNSNPPSREGSDNGDGTTAKKEYVPPSLMLQGKRSRVTSQSTPGSMPPSSRTVSYSSAKESSRPASRTDTATPPPPIAPATENADVQTIFVASSRDLENEFLTMMKAFEGKETEHNWAAREQAILRVRGMLKGDVHLRYPDVFLASLKDGFIQSSLKALVSLRTTVAANTCHLYSELAVSLGTTLDPFCDVLLKNLLKLASLTKKITAQQTQASVTAILMYTSAQPRLVIPHLWSFLQEKTVQTRSYIVGHLKTYLETHGRRAKNAIEVSGNLDILDKSIRKALADPNVTVREAARRVFWEYDAIWPDNGAVILESLDPTARKQLEKVCPNPDRQLYIPPTTPKVPKKSSVAAAIAASRAKAKAIATAPPTLRHQATSAFHNPPGQRPAGSPGSPTTSPRNSFHRPNSPLRLSASPPAARGPAVMARSVTTPTMSFHTRTPSGGLENGSSSIPSPPEPSTIPHRTSSSNTSPARGSILRKAMQTALPASPPPSTGQLSPTPRANSILSRNAAITLPPRVSTIFPQMDSGMNESLLLGQNVPMPLDDESEDDNSINLVSFSSPFQKFPPGIKKPLTPPESRSPNSVDSKPTAAVSNALSSGSVSMSISDQPIVEDALKARAEQAESAAERLLELVEPDSESPSHPALPPSLLVGSSNGVSSKARGARLPVTPASKASSVLKQAAMFQDSPAYTRSSLVDVLQETKKDDWWSKRKLKVSLKQGKNKPGDPFAALGECIVAVSSSDSVDLASTFYQLANLSIDNPVFDSPPASPDGPLSPTPFDSSQSMPSLHRDIWEKDKNFERLFRVLMDYLRSCKDGDLIEAGLITVSALIENQFLHMEGKEADVFSTLLLTRYCNQFNVLEATNAVRDMLTSKLEPVYGLTTIHASLKEFHAMQPPSPADVEIKAAAYAFGLIAIGKFILRLPAEVAEEELPRLRTTLISALNDRASLIIRESAAAAIIAAQLVLRDETHLFALLDGLADDKKNLLTYLFDKHGARGMTASNEMSGLDKLAKEIRRLDTRTSTPSRMSRGTT